MSVNDTMVNEVIMIQNDTPSSAKAHNKIWIDTVPSGSYIVPTIDEYNALLARVVVLERKLLNQ